MSDTNFNGSTWISAFARRRSTKLGALLAASGKVSKKVKGKMKKIVGVDAMDAALTDKPFMPAQMQDLENRVMMAVFTWDGSSSTDWSTGANWDKGSVPGNDDVALFANSGTNKGVTLSGNVAIEQIQITANGFSFDLNGKDITLDADNDNKANGTGTLAGTRPGVYLSDSAGTTITTSFKDGSIVLSDNTGDNFNFSAGTADTLTLDININDANFEENNANFLGGGTIVVSAAGGFDGTSSIAAGTTVISQADQGLGENQGSSATGATTITSGGMLQIDGGVTWENTGGLANTEDVNIAGTGVGSAGVIFGGSGVNLFNGNIAMTGDSTIGVTTGKSLELSGPISGAKNLTSRGPGTLILSGTSSYTKGPCKIYSAVFSEIADMSI